MSETTALTERQEQGRSAYDTIVAAALDKETDPERMERMFALAERAAAREAERQYTEAMRSVQARLGNVVRDADNSQTRSQYTRLETLMARARPIYTEGGFALSYGTDTSPLEGHYRVVLDVRHVGGHTQRFLLDAPIDTHGIKGAPVKTGLHGMGSTVSYCRRYLAAMAFNITFGAEDDDGNAAGRVEPTITEEQAEALAGIAADLGRTPEQLLGWLSAQVGYDLPSIDALPARSFDGAMRALKKRAAA